MNAKEAMTSQTVIPPPRQGRQRLSLERLREWESLGAGMFIHFGMSTFLGQECPDGTAPATTYAPDRLDVEQWVGVARDAGMKYAVLSAKHTAGFCNWPSRHNDYHVGVSGNRTDVVEAFVKACARRGIIPGLYYCSWDNHNRFGSRTWSDLKPGEAPETQYVTRAYEDFQLAQIEELLTNYGPIGEFWIDIPMALSRDYRNRLYARIAELQAQTLVVMNNGCNDGSPRNFKHQAWPTDVVTIERTLPNTIPVASHLKWRTMEGDDVYLPAEVCDPLGKDWFYVEGDEPRSDQELLGIHLITRARGANMLWDVGPDRHGLIPDRFVQALVRLRRNLDRFAA
jgi:alpha-L-fucosidase